MTVHAARFCHPALLALAVLAGVWSAPPAWATTTVYRCGDAAHFSDRPCPGARVMPPVAGLSQQQRLEALQVVQREQALASRLRSERLEEQRLFKPAAAAGIVDSTAITRRQAEVRAAAVREKASREAHRKPTKAAPKSTAKKAAADKPAKAERAEKKPARRKHA